MEAKDKNTSSNSISVLSVQGQIIHKAVYQGLYSLQELMTLRLTSHEFKRIVDEFLRLSPLAIEMFWDYLYAEFLYDYHLSYYSKEQFELFQKFCESLKVKEVWRTSENIITRLLVGLLEDTEIIIDEPQSHLEVTLEGVQERRVAEFPKGKKVLADNAQQLFDEMVFSINDAKKMFIIAAFCNFVGLTKDDLTLLSDEQKDVFEMLTTTSIATFLEPHVSDPSKLATTISNALPEEKYGGLMGAVMYSAALSLCLGKPRKVIAYGAIYFNLCGLNLYNNNFADRVVAGANFYNSNIRAVDFHGQDLTLTNFSGVWDLCLCNFKESNLRGTHMRGANLSHAVFTDADVSDADLRNTNFNKNGEMKRVNFFRANLRRARFAHLSVKGSSFREANLSQADMQQVYVDDVDFNGAKLRGARLGLNEVTKMKKLTVFTDFKKAKLYNYYPYIRDLIEGLFARDDFVSTGAEVVFSIRQKHFEELGDSLTPKEIVHLKMIASEFVEKKLKDLHNTYDVLKIWELISKKTNILFYKSNETPALWINIVELFVETISRIEITTDEDQKSVEQFKKILMAEIESHCTSTSSAQFFQPNEAWLRLKSTLLGDASKNSLENRELQSEMMG